MSSDDRVDDSTELRGYVDVWWQAVGDFTGLLDDLDESDWGRATDLPGWAVRDVAAHTGHLEHLLAGGTHDEVEIGDAPHARGMMGAFTEQGVVARRGRTPDDLVAEIRDSTTQRHDALLADPPTDGDAPAPGLFGAIGWSTRTLLRNRPLDVWMHEQDVRRAVDRPGNLDSAAAAHTAGYLIESLPFVLAKRAKAEPGSSVALSVEGHDPVTARVGDDGRGTLEPGAAPEATAALAMDRATFIVLAGGRRPADPDAVRIAGDADLARAVVEHLGVTP